MGEIMNVLVHGFNTSNPENTVGKLDKYLTPATIFDYGWFGLLSVIFRNKKEAERLKGILNPNDVVWAHSNGAAISVEAAKQGAIFDTLVCINPALKVDTVFPKTIRRIIVIHTEHDKPTRAAAFFDKVPFVQLIVPNAWGKMGAKGAKLLDERVYNMDWSNQLKGHSDFFDDDNLKSILPVILERL